MLFSGVTRSPSALMMASLEPTARRPSSVAKPIYFWPAAWKRALMLEEVAWVALEVELEVEVTWTMVDEDAAVGVWTLIGIAGKTLARPTMLLEKI